MESDKKENPKFDKYYSLQPYNRAFESRLINHNPTEKYPYALLGKNQRLLEMGVDNSDIPLLVLEKDMKKHFNGESISVTNEKYPEKSFEELK